jgi:cytoskeletal protein RodZ
MLGEALNVTSTDSDPPPDPSSDVGGRLRAAREARNLDLRDIASTTKISIGALEALEQNDFDPLPGGIFTRAFVRAYANEVGLDPEQTTRDFMAQAPVEATQDVAAQSEQEQMPSTRQVVETLVKFLVVGVPLAVVLVVGLRSMSTVSPGPEDTGALVDAVPAPPPFPPAAPVESESAAAASAIPEPLAILLRPRGESWVSLTVDGELVVSRIMQAGEEESYEAEDGITLNIGNAGQFDFTINQEDGRSLGGQGEVVTARITRDNYRGYLQP